MNLIYRILWFDDTAEFFDSLDREPFEEEVRSWGFVPEIEIVNTPDEFMAKQPWDRYDLIVVDYILGDKVPHGEEFIKQIRNHNVYTEIIFYSTNPSSDLWKLIHEKQLEGCFVANRQVILEKLQSVALQSVRKVLDLNNMRGMVMAEVGDIDQVLDSILRVGIPHLKPEQQAAIYKRFHEKSLEQAKGHDEKLGLFAANPVLEEMITLCDSNKRWENFNRLRQVDDLVQKFAGGDYAKEVLAPRNHLAHGRPRAVSGGFIFEWNGKEYKFDEKESLSLRKVILGYKQSFQDIHDMLSKRGT